MLRIHIRLPLNISPALEKLLMEHLEANSHRYREEVSLINSHTCGQEGTSGQQPADIMIGFMPEIEALTDEYLLEHFVRIPAGFPIRRELEGQGFADPWGIFHLFGIVPFVMFYNPDFLDEKEIPSTWDELLDQRWQGRIMMPGKEHIAPRIVRAVLKHNNPERASAVDENIVCSGVPPNVIAAIKRGEFSLGIANITFGKISEGLNIKMICPREGLLCAPQTVIWRKGPAEKILGLGEFLLSAEVQSLLTQQLFFPAAPGVGLPEIFREKNVKIYWPGWESYRQAIKQ